MRLKGPILTATDLTESSDSALRQAHAIAVSLNADLVACHVLPESYGGLASGDEHVRVVRDEAERRVTVQVQQQLQRVAGQATSLLPVRTDAGSPHAGILRLAAEIRAGLIAVGPGDTALRVARASAVPVLVARPSPVGGCVLGATDFSDPSLPAVHLAAEEAARRGVKLRLMHCLEAYETDFPMTAGLPAMAGIAPLPQSVVEQLEAAARDRLVKALAAAGASGEPVVKRRFPGTGIVEEAAEVATSLVVIGTRGRTGLARLLLGSVAEEVITSASCSVMVVALE